ncbi:hypothetical protein E2C01_031472 [Portunus trituberculatus]|uniref:Uncharacterized protein n=1 Tax=Portunus trituberculatus TaxID=210409 RepID=A0A5B7EWX6_PORTR|nr:hypothetical protein [Portunus trituberculatus]
MSHLFIEAVVVCVIDSLVILLGILLVSLRQVLGAHFTSGTITLIHTCITREPYQMVPTSPAASQSAVKKQHQNTASVL